MRNIKKHAWLMSALADKGYQQKDLAKSWDVDPAVVTRFIATGKPDLTPERAAVLCRMLGMDYNELMARVVGEAMPRGGSQKSPRKLDGVQTVEHVLDQIHPLIKQLKRLMPRAQITFSIDYSNGDAK